LATKSPSPYHNYWGVFATPGDLPNVSGSSTQTIGLRAGDIAWVTSKSRMYQCMDATASAALWKMDTRAIHDNLPNEIALITAKGTPTTSDLAMIEDASAAYAKKKATLGTLPYGRQISAIHDNVAAEISGITEKTTPVDADLILIEDSEAADAKKKAQLGNLPPGDEQSNLWFPPASPHAYNDEFDSDTLDASWSGWSFTLASAISLVTGVDVYDGSYTGNNLRYALNQSTRRSWCLLQAKPNTSELMYKTITVPTNLLIMARLKFNQYYQTADATDRGVLIGMFKDSSGHPDANNYAMCQLNTTASGGVFQGRFAVTTPIDNRTSDVDSQGQALEYVAIHKIGTTYHGWIGTSAGNWIYMGSGVEATALPHVAIYVSSSSTNKPGLGVVGVDFIRFYETDNFLF